MSKVTREQVINRLASVSFLSGVELEVKWYSGVCWLLDEKRSAIVAGTTREVYDALYAIQEFIFLMKDRGLINEKDS